MVHSHPRPYDADDADPLYDDLFSVASSMECTGLIPAAPQSVSETDAYSEIYDLPLAPGHGAPISGKTAAKRKRHK